MSDEIELRVVGTLKVHRAFRKRMGAKDYGMASIDLYDEHGAFIDTGSVFCESEAPTMVKFQFYKGQLSVKVS
jgi:hypothetical protein